MAGAESRILVIRLSSLGDLILIIPMLKALAASFPQRPVDLLTKSAYAPLFRGAPFLDRLILFERGDARELFRLRSQLSRERYGTVIDAHNVIRSTILFHTLRAGRKLQIRKDELGKTLLIRGKIRLPGSAISQSERYASLAEKLGARVDAADGCPPLPDEACALARERLSSRLRSRKGCVAFAPGARWKTKRWPADHFAKLISTVSARDYAPVLIGGTEDIADNAAIARAVSPEEPLDLTGSLSIIESAAILRECAALVTNDSAPLHLAEAVGTPVVALFGPTVREFGYYPILRRSMALEVDLPCRPCSRNGARSCPYGTEECLTSIEPEAVLEALLGVLRTAGRS